MSDADPIAARRARIGLLAARARRAGYGLFAVAVAVFLAGLAAGLDDLVTVVVVGCLALGSALLAPAIVVGYGVAAAERDDRRGDGHRYQ